MGTEFQFGKMDKVLGMDGGGGCMTMCVFLMPLDFNVHLKMVKMRLY